ncbi:MAG: glycosyltransferase [Nanoarchaeota archaeon]|nr:glycosyltransferase [Nanoarchaeota archaeon]MBU1269448.1 glycosyltransferase [Nanoarchaeota archaeon]MBU1604605.1 glycosyltransferase [Nanoarchaeota archaeon]MBU2442755.1 glycosyltransferase [Nanoarchaeota archaeon]
MISVVIPFLSGFEDLKVCIASIKKQRVKVEIIIVNDSSKPLRLKKGVRVIDNKGTKGAAYSRNIGLKESKNDLVLFVDNDVFLQSGCVRRLLDEIEGFEIVFPKVVYENSVLMHPVGKEEIYPQISACFMIKKSAVEKMDCFFDETYKIYLEDADFFLRANIFSLKSLFVKDAVAIHKLKESYNEMRFYLENKNLFYGIIKFFGIKKKGVLHPFNLTSVFSNYICALFNFDKFDYSHYNRGLSILTKAELLFRKHKKITGRNRLFLLFYIFKAKMWVISNIGFVLRERRKLLFKKQDI